MLVADRLLSLERNCHDRLFLGATAAFALLLASNVGLVDLHDAAEQISARPQHRLAQFVQHHPRGPVAAQPQRAGAELLVGDVPRPRKPDRQRHPGLREDRARCRRRLPDADTTGTSPAHESDATAHQALLTPDKRTRQGPAQPLEVGHARFIVGEPDVQLRPTARESRPAVSCRSSSTPTSCPRSC